jgi:hypothetical protein
MHHSRMNTYGDDQLKLITRNLQLALLVEFLVQVSFIAALFATLGAFNGGEPTTTPFSAQAYIVVGFLVTIVVIIRTFQMQAAAKRGDTDALRRLNVRAWALIAFIFSAIIGGWYLFAAAAYIPRR